MKKIGKQTIQFDLYPQVIAASSIVGPHEKQGPLGDFFDQIIEDGYNQQNTWEDAQIKMAEDVIESVLAKAKLSQDQIDYLLAGDLLNQTAASNFAAEKFSIPFLGLFGACSTIVEALIVAAIMVEGNAANNALAFTSSHYQATERQFRTPNEYGDKYPPYKQKTVTAAGGILLDKKEGGCQIREATVGKVVNLGVKDAQDLGSAMAPAAADTILQHFKDTGRSPDEYDLIITGDLGKLGKEMLLSLLNEQGFEINDTYQDCGVKIYNDQQKVGAGGSGCGCSAAVIASYLLPELMLGKFNKIFILGTGALLNPTTTLQKHSIPAIAHGVVIESSGHVKVGIGNQNSRQILGESINNKRSN